MSTATATPNLLTRAEAADYLSVSVATLATWACCRRYGLPYVKVGRAVRYKREDLDRFLQERTVAGSDS